MDHRQQAKNNQTGFRQHLLSRVGVVCCLLLVVCSLFAVSCSEWDTDSLGSSFTPANSQVHTFTHLVYVEYTTEGARVWGPCANEVECEIDRQHVSVTNTKTDSLAIVAYGYTVIKDSIGNANSSLKVDSKTPYALYLNNLSLHSANQPVIQSVNDVTCHVVLPAKSRNNLYGSLCIEGEMTLSGTGTLNVTSRQSAIQAASLQCQYGVTVSLRSSESHGIELSRGAMRSTLGSWYIDAAQNAVHCPDTLFLRGGTYQGTSRQAAFFSSCAILRCPTLMAAAAKKSQFMDSTFVAQRYDSVQAVWQQQIDTLAIQADSLYQIHRNGSKSATLKFTPAQSIQSPYMLICKSAIWSTDTLQFIKTTQKK